MTYIEFENGRKINKGNFTFIYDKTGSQELFDKFLDFESFFKLNYIDFSHKIRIAYESFALIEECKYRKHLQENSNKSSDEIEKEIINEITAPNSILNYKKILIRLTKNNAYEYMPMLIKYQFNKGFNSDPDGVRVLKYYLQFIYNFASMSSHANRQMETAFIPNKNNCLRIIGSFHDFLCIYYGINKKFDSTLIPIRDYYAVPKSICEEMGLSLDIGKYLFIREKKNRISYNIFSSDIDNISLSQRRDIDTINKLWEDNFDDPSNIIRQIENISSSNGDYKFQVYSLPGRPYKLSIEMLKGLTTDDKLDIITGICHGILSMHEYATPFYHRNICPEAFYIFNIQGKYKALLARFDCTKDTSSDAEYTVLNNVEKKVSGKHTNQFFAPEVIRSDSGMNVDWEKADIYSLAKISLYILAGKVISDDDETEIIESCEIDDEIKYMLLEMLSDEPVKRPAVNDLLFKLS